MAWIYNLVDYQHIFALSDQELQKNVLDYPGGISSVNAELSALGKSIISADPFYHLGAKEMSLHAQQILDKNIQYLNEHADILENQNIAAAEIIKNWKNSVELFLADYEIGKREGRYLMMSVPPQTINRSYELLLCADLLFNQQELLPAPELMASLCNLAAELRIFPLIAEKKVISGQLGPIMLDLQQRNFGVEIRAINYPLRRDATAMLRVWAKECEVL